MDAINKLFIVLVCLSTLCSCKTHAQDIVLVNNGASDYNIIIPEKPTRLEQKAAQALQKYIKQASGCEIKIANEEKRHLVPAIYIGETFYGGKAHPAKVKQEGYIIQAYKENILIKGGSGQGLMYGVYSFIENYVGCKKLSNEPAIVPNLKIVSVPGTLNDERQAEFEYREVYYPASRDNEYLTWNKLHRFEDLWGVWGHSYNKLVPARKWFATHPEYYALVKGVRQPSQLCLSNGEVLKIVIAELKTRMTDNPDAMYWSVSPNDDNGNCQCDQCKAKDDKEGGQQGSLIEFVNKVAKEFPDKKITTLAYGYTHKAPKNLKPADNVYIFLSDIDAYRDKPLPEEGTAAGFRHDLEGWRAVTPNIFVWDYITQFTNYLAPFPNFQTLQANMQFFREKGVKGVFEQGSGDIYSEWAELRSYLTARLLWDPKIDLKKTTTQFLADYYGAEAAKYLQQYIDMMQEKMKESKRKLDIYGNPINEYNTWLTPELIDKYSDLFDKAATMAENNAVYLERLTRCRLALDYTVLQQARFYGIEQHGIFVKDDNNAWVVKPRFKDKLNTFITNCKKAGVTELSEGGSTPDQYQTEWDSIFTKGVTQTKAVGATVTLKYPFAGDYPAKGNRTLVDGNPGYKDFSYNWLCFYGVPMVATIELEKPVACTQIKMHFLDDPRHWIFLPENIIVEVSKDGIDYKQINDIKLPAEDEHYDITVPEFSTPVKLKKNETIKFVRVTANNLTALPNWRSRDNKKPMIACDEIYVQ